METKELRIGNLIHLNNSEKKEKPIIKIEAGVQIDNLKFINCSFIPLTEEWLLKFGFEKMTNYGAGSEDENYHFWKNVIGLSTDFRLTTSTHDYESYTVDGAKKLQYVHQLQNLYFALTGKELKIQ